MENIFYIQRDGECAKNIWNFFKIDANLGFSSDPILNPSNGDIYVNPETGFYYVYNQIESIWNQYEINNNAYVNCAIDSTVNSIFYSTGTYKFTDGVMILDYNYIGISVSRTEDINKLPNRKTPYSEDWKDEQGVDTYLPVHTFYEPKDVKIQFLINGNSAEEVRYKYEAFLAYISGGGYVNYFDTYRKNGFRGYYKEHKIISEKYSSSFYQNFEITITVDRLCFGYSSLECPLIGVNYNEGATGEYEVYTSNGGYGKFNSPSVFGGEFNFIILVPDFIDMINLSCITQSVVGFQYESDNNVVGFEYDGESYVVGI